MTAAAYDYEGLRVVAYPRRAPNGPKHDTRSNGLKDGVAAPWQILDADLFRRFLLIPNSF